MNKKYTLIFSFLLLISSAVYTQTANWSPVLPALFPTNVSGQIHGISRVSQMKFHPTNSSKMYAVSARGGLYISANGGNNWTHTPGTDNMPFSTFASVCIDYTNDQILYLGAGDHNYYSSWGGATGVWKSTNGGQTYTQTTLNNKIIVEMIMDPLDHNVIVAATNGGIYKTINGGTSWTLKTSSITFDDLKQRTPVSRMLFAATTGSGFYRSTDFGETWTQITSGIVLPAGITNGAGCRIAVTPADTTIVYLGMVANGGTIYKSTDAGLNFSSIKNTASPYLTYYSNLSTSSSQGDYNFGIGVDRTNANILYLVAHNVWKSTDGGVNWTQLTNWWEKVHTDMHQVITSPYNNSQLWNMNDGGVWLSMDGGITWAPKSDGIYGYEIYHGNCSPTRRDMFSIGTQDNGELYATSAGWFTNRGGDWGSQCSFDYRTNSSMVYYHENNKRRLVTGGDQTYGLPANVTLLQDIAFNRSNTNLAFVGDTVILRTTNLQATTPTWVQIANLNKKIMAMHSSFADANRLYVITSDGFIHVSTDALAATPTFTSYALPNTTNNAASITSIKTAPNTLYITCNTKVYKSIDNGVNWTNVTYNLPSVNHERILADEYISSGELVFIASNNTVYYKVANGVTWTIYSTSLPSRTTINDMSIYNDGTPNTLLRVSTYGRGMWETPITNIRTLNANFSVDNANPCPGESLQFTDLSTGNVTSYSWSFPGGTPSTSTLQNPVVTYNASGSYSVTLTVSDGTTSSTLTQTDYISIRGGNLPLAEGFETADDPPVDWLNIDNGTQNYKWAKTTDAGGFGTSATSMMFNNYSWNVPGERDELRVKRVDLTGYQTATLTFDVAYQVYTGYSDSLAVLISPDCGTNYTRIWVKGGSTLSTAGSGTNNFIPTAAQWRTETIDLTPYAGQAIVSLEFQNINGYGNRLYIDNVNISATVNANAGTDRTICSGSSTSIGMTAVNGVSYSWLPVTGLTSSMVSNPTASPTITTTYILTATQTESGIFKRDTVIINVTPSVTPAVSIASNPTGAVCPGTSITFTATPTNGGTPSYQWKKNGVNTGTNSPTFISNSLINGDVILCVMTSTVTCVTSPVATSNSITVSITPNVTAGISIAAGSGTTICPGTSVTFTATPVNGGTTPVYQWKKGATNVGTNSNTYTTNTLANGDVITCQLISNAACVLGSPATSNPITMTVNPAIVPGISISASPGNVACSGSPVTFTATPVNGGANPSFQWKIGSTLVGTNSTVFTSSTLTTGNVISCVMTSVAPCASPNPVSSNTINMTVLPNVSVSVSISASPGNTICSGSSVTFSASPVNGGTQPVYQWKKGTTNVGTNSPTYSTNTLADGDVISCVMTSNANCTSGNPATSNTITMMVNPADNSIPVVSIFNNCNGTSVLTASGYTGSLMWSDGGTNNPHTVSVGGSYTVYQYIGNCQSPSSLPVAATPSGPADDGNACTNDVCNSQNGTTSHNPVTVDDNNSCTTDGCISTSGVYHTPLTNTGGGATDNNQCTEDNCFSGQTVHPAINTDDGNVCTTDGCISNSGVFHTSLTTIGGGATDNNLCTDDNCLSGQTVHVDIPTDDGDVCTTDACDSGTGAISHTPVSTDDFNPCTLDGCNSLTGVFHQPIPCGLTLNMKLFIEGFYSGSGYMQNGVNALSNSAGCLNTVFVHASTDPADVDTVMVALMSPNTPHVRVDSAKGILKTNGALTVTFNNAAAGNYFLKINHRNSIETWSASEVNISTSSFYDFSDANNKAYGNNMQDLGDGNFAIFSGDIADGGGVLGGIPGLQDGITESTDYGEMENATYVSATGYVQADVSGDGIVESSDYGIMENAIYFVRLAIHP